MTRQSLISRRRILTTVGTGTAAALAGCSGNGQDGSGNGEDEPDDTQTGTESSTEDTESETTEGQDTETTTETESQFSTEGDDSAIIDTAPEDLVVTSDSIPMGGYSLDETQSGSDGECSHFSRIGQSQDGEANIRIRADVCDSVSVAQNAFDTFDYSALVGAPPDDSEELAIAVKSVYSIGTHSSGSGSFIKFRDANAVGFILWTTDSDPIEKQTIGELAITMHQSWR